MIVKNEERVLKRCLDSIADLMDEIIIVDTGSTDKTKEIASAYTEKIYDFAWIHDFAAARNFAFSKASCDYIYSADADEVLDETNRTRFKQLKQVLMPEVEMVQMYYVNDMEHNTTYNFEKEYRPKLFKRKRDFVWIDPVHETVRLDPVVFDSDIEILHKPEGGHEGRDFAIFQQMEQRGQELSKKLHHMYAMELFIAGSDEDFLAAEPCFSRMMRENRSLDEVKEGACVLVRCYRLKGDIHHFFQYCLKDVASEPCAEICYELGSYYREKGDLNEAMIWFYNAAFETESILNVKYNKEYPLTALAECCEDLGDDEQAEGYRRLLEE